MVLSYVNHLSCSYLHYTLDFLSYVIHNIRFLPRSALYTWKVHVHILPHASQLLMCTHVSTLFSLLAAYFLHCHLWLVVSVSLTLLLQNN